MLKMTKDVINAAAFTSQCSCGSALSADKSRATPSWARPVQHFTTKHRMLQLAHFSTALHSTSSLSDALWHCSCSIFLLLVGNYGLLTLTAYNWTSVPFVDQQSL